ncbi:hypothetical protein HDV05_003559 [Chytridiales sp. JEL 0842]|nr:hypothetical protein HDV05_003559 [Chytridiales sp. JEL 0842]
MSLPYIDKEYDDPALRAYVDQLIEQEKVQTPKPSTLLGDSFDRIFEDNDILKEELLKASQGQKTSAIDTARFRLEPPKPTSSSSSPNDQIQPWKAAVDNSKAQLEHQQNRLLNMELINQFGSNAWRLHNFQLEAEVKRLQDEVSKRKVEIQELNKSRKLEQQRAGITLTSLEARWAELVDQNLRLDIANQLLEAEVEAMKVQQSI